MLPGKNVLLRLEKTDRLLKARILAFIIKTFTSKLAKHQMCKLINPAGEAR